MADEKNDLERVTHVTPIDIMARDAGGLRPHYPASYGYGYSYGSEDQKIHLRELWRTVRKRKWLVVTLALVITTLVTIEMYRTKDIFQASTMIEVGKDTSRLGSPGGNIFGDDYDPFYMVNMKTKMLMVKSHALLESVVVENRLDQNPRFLGAGGKKSVWEALKLMGAKVGITDRPTSEESAMNDPAARQGGSPFSCVCMPHRTQEPKMSRGMPSMTALLGMLAIAGYQNRDKLADMFRNATSGQPAGAKDSLSGMLGNLGGLVGGGGVSSLLNGGIGELLEHFKQNGQGDAAQSWINQGPNREVTPPELQQAIGPDVLQKLEQQTGLSQQEILDRLSRELPAAVDKYTPDGRLPAPSGSQG